MDKYTLLLLLNLPFVLLGLYKGTMLYQTAKIGRVGFLFRLVFWITALFGLLFAREVYDYLTFHKLTDSTPLSLADVVLTTGVITAITMCFRLYTLMDALDSRLSQLNEKLSILNSTKQD